MTLAGQSETAAAHARHEPRGRVENVAVVAVVGGVAGVVADGFDVASLPSNLALLFGAGAVETAPLPGEVRNYLQQQAARDARSDTSATCDR